MTVDRAPGSARADGTPVDGARSAGGSRRGGPHAAAVGSLTDSGLGDLLLSALTRQAAAEELLRRHGGALLAYARALCRDEQCAEVLLVEALNRTLDVFQRGNAPGVSWVLCLLGELRRLAAERADDRRTGDLSADFLGWLHRRKGAQESFASVIAAAEEDCPLLHALHRLPGPAAVEVWLSLAAAPGTPPARQALRVPERRTQQELLNAYLRAHTVGVPYRRCRHLAARLVDGLDGDTPCPELTGHLSGCGTCARALADLRAIHRWDTEALREGTLLRLSSPAAVPDAGPGARQRPAPAAVDGAPRPTIVDHDVPRASPAGSGSRRHRREKSVSLSRTHRRAAVGAAGLGAAALAVGLALAPAKSPTDAAGSAPPVPRPFTGPASPGGSPTPPAASVLPSPTGPADRGSPSANPIRSGPSTPASTAPVSPTVSTRSSPTVVVPPPPPSPTPSPPGVLRRGDQGDDVLALQRLLLRAACNRIGVSFTQGRFDEATAAVLMSFQRDFNIRGEERTQTLYGPQTRAALERRAANPDC
ncbi:hypothetical protein [Kitasatospora sp. NPDC088346]|uniref:hypothetical protein n=1 Tax=Kitasatospora sp. NPDC088346 TaxID=3364073 RepID=UPI0038190648